MSDFPDAPTTAPSANGNTYIQATKESPVAQSVKDQSAKASNELGNLAAARRTPSTPAATGQPLTHYHSFFFELISWNNPRASAIAYSSIVTLIFAARYLDVLRYSLKLTWMVLGTTVLAELAGKLVLNNGLATQLRPRRYYVIPRETLDAAIGDVHELVNFFVIEAQRIVFAENVGASAAAFIGAFIAYYLVKIVPFWGLSLIATTALFMVPLLYTSNQELIDAQLNRAGEVINQQTSQFRTVASKHTAEATNITKQYVGDYTAKAQQLLGRRSASPEASRSPAPQSQAPADVRPSVEEQDFPAPPKADLQPEPVVPDAEEKTPMVAS
ncbi:cell lysis protein [Colletotrichum tofieldiae]|uniref:Reticulon-like protein n=1 Tax=Colletotrichum liriopes TaxID=708192 RepID=A0AA37GCQ5_9PEZI|nr:reticulon-like protein 1 [Colletotrichum liriopes]GKT62041.1 cell lysis protein [Colletotrichum tofieldiae]GKT69908.1 cell lysis protein [Colletotrichum tofieldiae]